MTNDADYQSGNARLWQAALAGYWLLLFTGTHLPKNVPILPGGNIDKLVHATVYAVLAGLLAITWRRSAGSLTLRHLRWAWIALAIYAALDELTQIPVGRDGDVFDWCADAVGALVGLAIFRWLSAKPQAARKCETPPAARKDQ